jgi:hypothetical protein
MMLKDIWEHFSRFAEAMDPNPLEDIERRLRYVETRLATRDDNPTATAPGDRTDAQDQQGSV